LNTEILGREQDRLDAETKIKIEEAIAGLKKTASETLLNLEKAETEDSKNQINKYTAQVGATIDMLTAIGADNARTANRRNERQAQQTANLPRGLSQVASQ